MSFEIAFNILWIVSVLFELWLYFLCRRTESYTEVHVYVLFCMVRAVVCSGLILHCPGYAIVWTWFRYMAMPLRGMVGYGAWRSRKDRIWRDVLFGLIVGTGAEAACGLLKSYFRPECGAGLDLSLDLIERLFFCVMLGLWIETFWKNRGEKRLIPRRYA